MGFDKQRLITGLKNIAPALTLDEAGIRGRQATLILKPEQLVACAALLLEHGLYLVFVTAVHVHPTCELVYQFNHYKSAFRINLRLETGRSRSIPSIAPIYQGAAWHEREIYDFFGIEFQNHPGLKPIILTREEKGLCPLIRDGQQLKMREEIFPGDPHE